MKKKGWKRQWFVFLGLVIVLLPFAQSFINGMTAIALTEDKEKNEQQLFDNEYGKASIQYQIKENHVDWQINIHKNDNKGPTRLTYSLQDVKDKAVILPTTVKDDQSSGNLFEVKTDKSIADYGQVVEKEVSTAIKNDQIKFTTPVVSEVNLKVSLNTKTNDKAEEVGFSKEYPITLVKANVTESTTIQSSLASSTVESTATSSSEATKESTSGDVTNLGDADEATVDSAKKEAEKKYEETGRPQTITRSAAEASSNPIQAVMSNGLMIGQDSFSNRMSVFPSEEGNNVEKKFLDSPLKGDGDGASLGTPEVYTNTIRNMFSPGSRAYTVYVAQTSLLKSKYFSIKVFYDNVGYYNLGTEEKPDLRSVGAVLTVSNIVFTSKKSAAIQFSNNMYSGVSYRNIQSMSLNFKFYDTSFDPHGTPEQVEAQKQAIQTAINQFNASKGQQPLTLAPINFAAASNSYLSFASLNSHESGGVLSSYEFAGARTTDGKVKTAAVITEDGKQQEIKGDLVALNGGQRSPNDVSVPAARGTYFGDIVNHKTELNPWNDNGDELGLPNFWRTGVSFNLEGVENNFVLGSEGGEAWNTFSSNAFIQMKQTTPYKTVEPLIAFDEKTKTWDGEPNYENRRDNDLDRLWELPTFLRAKFHDPMVENEFLKDNLAQPLDRYVPQTNGKFSYYYFISQPMINLATQSVILPDTITISDILPEGISLDDVVVYDLKGNSSTLKKGEDKDYIISLDQSTRELKVTFTANGTKKLNIQSGAFYAKETKDPNPVFGGDVSIRLKVTANEKAKPYTDIDNQASSSFSYSGKTAKVQYSNKTAVQIPDNIKVKATKKWDDDDNRLKIRPTIHLNLERKLSTEKDYKPLQGPEYSFEIKPDASAENSTHTFTGTGLSRMNENGIKYDYRVVEKYLLNGEEKDTFKYYSEDKKVTTTDSEDEYIFTNTLNTLAINLLKKDTSGTPLKGAKFQIKSKETDSALKDISVEGESDENGKITFDSLPEGNYILSEVLSPTGILMKDATFSIELNEEKKLVITKFKSSNELTYKDGNFVAVNRYVNLNFTKTDAETSGVLDGARFSLNKLDEPKENQESSGNKGIFSFEKLKPGSYELKETKAPDGYQNLKDAITFTIESDGTISNLKGSALENEKIITDENGNMSDINITFDVPNKPKVPLPATGGMGVWLIYGTGALAIIVAGGYYFLRNKSKGEA